ncbi:MAG: DUF2971 domain-containing protein [Bacteroidetes bacterium]|nr:DUF2971 domain-containing protein [Bacteroidota bacterium]
MARKTKQSIFYKYHKLNIHLYELLLHNRFYLASHKEANDPYDCRCKLTREYVELLYDNERLNSMEMHGFLQEWRASDLYNEDMSIYNWALEQDAENENATLARKSGKPKLWTIPETLDYIFDNEYSETKFNNEFMECNDFNVVSFSVVDENRDLPMWAYYAGAFDGVRIKLDFNEDATNFRLQSIRNVKYSTWTQVKNDADLKRAYFTKAKNWRNEQEWRIGLYTDKFLTFDKLIVKEITFGHRVSIPQMMGIIKMCIELGYNAKYFIREFTANGLRPREVDIKEWRYIEYINPLKRH